MKELTLSVHTLVDYLLRRGSIDTRIYNQETMLEGTRIHLRYQRMQNGTYLSEVSLFCNVEVDGYLIHLHGRADGIILNKDRVIIDEIKSTNDDLEHFYAEQNQWHLGQGIVYAYMYLIEHNLEEIGVRLTYISQIDDSRMIKDFIFSKEQLKEKVISFIKEYLEFYSFLNQMHEERNASCIDLKFPFKDFRKNQREVSKYVYNVANNGGTFFFEAPTGTGKTMSCLYPSILTFKENINDKIFYLSAKAQARDVGLNAMNILTKGGFKGRSIALYSRETMCLNDQIKCNPDDCPFAKDYYDKINRIVLDILKENHTISKDVIFNYAQKNNICPFECQLDVSTYVDVIICDYNYLFDPVVFLKRFFEQSKTPYFALIDEAHNLAERTKDMYTISLNEDKLYDLLHSLKRIKAPKLKRAIKKIITIMHEECGEINDYIIKENDFSIKFYNGLDNFAQALLTFQKEENDLVNDEFTEISRTISRFNKIRGFIDEHFVTYFEMKDNALSAYIRCIDSSSLISSTLNKIRGAVFFSATLTPIEYYINTLGGNENTPYLKLPSPFDKENLCLLVRSDISTYYKDRETSYREIAKSIKAVTSSKVGNYLVFFSSYSYLNYVLNYFEIEDENIIVQDASMGIKEREAYLNNFQENPQYTTIGFAVLGGAFSEGIDLVSSRLIGAIIVGVGLPMVSFERDLLKNYYNSLELDGFDYAYTNPGKNKVMQAAGRVIRTQFDKGVVLLIDKRYGYAKYKDLFKLEWSHYKIANNVESIKNHLKVFWNDNND